MALIPAQAGRQRISSGRLGENAIADARVTLAAGTYAMITMFDCARHTLQVQYLRTSNKLLGPELSEKTTLAPAWTQTHARC